MKKNIIAAVVALLAAAGVFFGGMAASDPTASSAYKSVEKDLADSESQLASTQEELDGAVGDLGQSEQELSDAQVQLDALVSEAQDDVVVPQYEIVTVDENIGPAKLNEYWVYTSKFDYSTDE